MSFNALVILSAASDKHIGALAQDYASQVLAAAAEEYGFSLDEAKAKFLVESVRVSRLPKKRGASKVENKTKKAKPSCILPFCGQKQEGSCCGIRLNHQLFTQCTNPVSGEDFCKTCQTQADKNGGKPTYGTIADRLAVGLLDYQVNGKQVVRFSKVMDKLKITHADAVRCAEEAGVEIAAEQFEVVVSRKGRPPAPKDPSVSDSDSMSSSKGSKKAPGRPKKSAKVVKSETSDDLIAALVAEATPAALEEATPAALEEGEISEVISDITAEANAPSKTDITKSNLGTLKEMCAAAGLDEGKKSDMQTALRTHFGYESDAESNKKETKKPAQKKVEEPVEETVSELSAEESAEEEDEEEGEECEDFNFEGKSLKRITSEGENKNVVVDNEGTPVGRWNPETDKVEWDEDEDEEEED